VSEAIRPRNYLAHHLFKELITRAPTDAGKESVFDGGVSTAA
jgi:hypothetical protein